MTETGNCHFLKPLPSDHPKTSELTYMFICSFDSSTSEEYLGGWNSVLSHVPWACLAAFCMLFLFSDSWPRILHRASQNWGDACQKSSQLGQCPDHTLLNWLIPLLPTNLIFTDDFTFFYIQEFSISISLCNTRTKDNSPAWTGRTLPYLFQHHTGYWMSWAQHHFVQYLVQKLPV